MKTQYHLSQILDENGNVLTFDRWQYKRLSTVQKYVKQLYSRDSYKTLFKTAKTVTIYETNYGSKDGPKVWEMNIADL